MSAPPPDAVTGVVLAGGRGTRLAPLTDRTSKQLLPVGGRPLVARVLGQLVRAGIADVLLLIDDRHAGDFLRVLRDGRDLGLRSLGYVWQPPSGAGMAAAIARAEPHLRTDRFMVACGDVLIDAPLGPSVRAFAAQPDGALLVATRTADTAGYTPLRVEDGRVTALGDKDPDRHGPGWTDLGCYLYGRDAFDHVRSLRPSARGEVEIWDLNRRYADAGTLRYKEVKGWWCDVGTSREVYRRADERYKSNSRF
ncbi:sugar phosphate nucleotidyltransferase [Actinomadura harenae]|uniref:Glucose-1-phosphate thymidylyltransferase n=1 Tax=Actinomadura harenae TaxID=2483351 RepID=A0A3M2LFJ0_9ACTN|nr:sugar phosphate nucleotidyltransferase [Actinomadura harenae]RMI36174.1 sugar nucleotidyltransferase [Actinomadura harenae]